jgi:hypothetical protein
MVVAELRDPGIARCDDVRLAGQRRSRPGADVERAPTVVIGQAVRLAREQRHPGQAPDYDRQRAKAWKALYLDPPSTVATHVMDARMFLLDGSAGVADVKLPPPADEGPVTSEARRWVMETESDVLSTEIKLFDQELLSQPARVDLLKAKLDNRGLRSLSFVFAHSRRPAVSSASPKTSVSAVIPPGSPLESLVCAMGQRAAGLIHPNEHE